MTVVNLVATARPTFAVELAQERLDAARQLLIDLGAELVGPTGLVMTPEDAAAARRKLVPTADLFVHICATFSDAAAATEFYGSPGPPVLLWAFREPGEAGDRIFLNSLCGTNLAAHALVRAGRDVRLCYGDPDEPGVRELLSEALDGRLPPKVPLPRSSGERAPADVGRTALTRVRGARIGAAGDGPTGFTPSEYDPDVLAHLFHIEVAPHSLTELLDEAAAVPVAVRERERGDARDWQPGVAELDADTADRFASVTVALRDWHERERLDAVAVRCWPEFPADYGLCPCSSLSRLADEDVTTACERDVYGATTALLLDALGAGPTHLVDAVDVDEGTNVVRFWHCGAAATRLAGADATLSVHPNRKIGVAGDFALKPGRVCVARLTEDPDRHDGLRLLIAGGEALDAPNRFQGTTAEVRLDSDAREFVHGLVTGGFPHHVVLAWRDVRPGLRTIADQLGIPVIELH